jgi:hypothetical protein
MCHHLHRAGHYASPNRPWGCTAGAITVAGGEDHAACVTFIDTGTHGGLPKVLADVGACQRSECVHNDHLMCQAPEVHVGPGPDNADCLTYAHR